MSLCPYSNGLEELKPEGSLELQTPVGAKQGDCCGNISLFTAVSI